jgi:hypothetical protein
LPAEAVDVAHAIRSVTGHRSPGLAIRRALGPVRALLSMPRRLRVAHALRRAIYSRLPERPTQLVVLMAGCALGFVLAAAGFTLAYTGTLRDAWERYGLGPLR